MLEVWLQKGVERHQWGNACLTLTLMKRSVTSTLNISPLELWRCKYTSGFIQLTTQMEEAETALITDLCPDWTLCKHRRGSGVSRTSVWSLSFQQNKELPKVSCEERTVQWTTENYLHSRLLTNQMLKTNKCSEKVCKNHLSSVLTK